MSSFTLSQGRMSRVLSVGAASAASLYLLVVFVAEPMRSLAATTADTVVTYTVTSALSLTCDAASTTGTTPGNGSAGTGALATAKCTPITNSALGYTLSWIIQTSTGSTSPICTGNCYGTGHLLSNNVTSGKPDTILAFPRFGSHVNQPGQIDSTTVPTASGAVWGARLMANSTTAAGASVTWGADTDETMPFLNVATGSAVNIAKRTTETASTGDIQNFLFKVYVPASSFVPTGTYKARIRFTVVDN